MSETSVADPAHPAHPALPAVAVRRARVMKADDVRHLERARLASVARESDAARQAELQAELAAAYDAGHAAGVAAAEASAAGAAARVATALETAAAGLADEAHHQVERSARTILAAAVDIAEWVLRREVSNDTRALVARLAEASVALVPSPEARIRVAAGDADAVRQWVSRASGDYTVVVDETLQRGDALIESDSGNADLRLAAAMRVAAEMLGVDPAGYPS